MVHYPVRSILPWRNLSSSLLARTADSRVDYSDVAEVAALALTEDRLATARFSFARKAI